MTARRRRLGGVALALALAVLGAGCGGDDGPVTAVEVGEEKVPATRLADALQGVCQARAHAAVGDVEQARRTFFDRSHDTLHVLALALEPVDRAKAGELLLAKQLVEADLESTPVREGLARDLGRLGEVTRSALARLEISTPACE
ncbi:MAG: hypothetical protein M3O23_09925 [Actinomycetota bacterium]|nr:hypothetical protein [Actinomycetota bacterium]